MFPVRDPLEPLSDILLSSQIVIDVVATTSVHGIAGDLRAKATPKRTMKSHTAVNATPTVNELTCREMLGEV
jgi:hypothetical protein